MAISQNRSIRDLQTALQTVSEEYPEIERVNIDGIYGPETTRSVTQFQYRFGLEPSGTVDLDTWTHLFDLYSSIRTSRKNAIPLNIFPPETTLTFGSDGDAVWIVQIILRALGDRYENFGSIVPSGNYDAKTSDEIRRFQRIVLLPETGRVDKATWNSLARWYGAFRPESAWYGN